MDVLLPEIPASSASERRSFALRPFSRALIALGTLLVVTLAGTAIPARAQTGDRTVRIQLLRQPVWHTPTDRLGLTVRITNGSAAALDGFRLQVRTYSRITSRSDLAANLEIDPTRLESSSFSHDVLSELGPGRSRTVRLNQELTDLSSLAAAGSGIYPLAVTLTDLEGLRILDSITTFLIYLANDVEVPLAVVPIWPLGELPARGPGGVFRPHPLEGAWHLDEAIADRGWLTSLVAALQTQAGRRVRLGLVPVPRTSEELADMVDGYDRMGDDADTIERLGPGSSSAQDAARTISQLRDLMTQARAQPLLSPYSFPDLPPLTDALEPLQLQLAEGEAAVEEAFGVATGRGWVFAPAGRLDADSLDAMHGLQAAAGTVFAAGSLTTVDEAVDECAPPFEGGTYTCPVSVETTGGRTRGYVLDTQLQERLVDLTRDDRRVALQFFFAETAMIWAELPGDPDRVVTFVVPSALHLRPQATRLFIRTLGRAPWLTTLTPRGGLHRGIGAGARDVVDELPTTALGNDSTYQLALDDAAEALEDFARLRPPAALLQRLTRTYLVAQSRSWGSDPLLRDEGIEFARSVDREVGDEFDKISIASQRDITLTSRAGELPLVLRNDTDYEVTLEINLEWRDLDLKVDHANIRETFGPGVSPVPIQATAKGSGIFPVEVTLSTVDGTEIDNTLISIRSTQFNEIALAITLGALAFLVLFYIYRAVAHRRRNEA